MNITHSCFPGQCCWIYNMKWVRNYYGSTKTSKIVNQQRSSYVKYGISMAIHSSFTVLNLKCTQPFYILTHLIVQENWNQNFNCQHQMSPQCWGEVVLTVYFHASAHEHWLISPNINMEKMPVSGVTGCAGEAGLWWVSLCQPSLPWLSRNAGDRRM